MSSEKSVASQGEPGNGAVVTISSAVVYGNVGIRATVAGLEAMGQRAIEVPTVVLANHPGLGPAAGVRIEAQALGAILDALEDLGQLDQAGAVMTGYFASAEQVAGIADRLARLRTRCRDLVILVDPVIGDEKGGLYVEERVAVAIRDRLLPMASIVTPNRFELGWLSGRRVESEGEAVAAARALAVGETVATSVAESEGTIVTLAVTRETLARRASPRLAAVPHGTGDLLAGLYLGKRLSGADAVESLAGAMRLLERMVEKSAGRAVLDLEIPC